MLEKKTELEKSKHLQGFWFNQRGFAVGGGIPASRKKPSSSIDGS